MFLVFRDWNKFVLSPPFLFFFEARCQIPKNSNPLNIIHQCSLSVLATFFSEQNQTDTMMNIQRYIPTMTPTMARHFASRGAKGWGWYHRAKEDIAKGTEDPLPYPENTQTNLERKKIFLELEGLDEDNATNGKMVFELANDLVPRTCENFERLCTHENGHGYKGTVFHQVLRDQVAVGGEVGGSGGKSSFATTEMGDRGFFKDENFSIPHSHVGVLSMVPDGTDQNGSQFLITLGAECEHLNGRHVAFGRLVEGEEVLNALNGVFAVHGKPLTSIVVKDCGVVV